MMNQQIEQSDQNSGSDEHDNNKQIPVLAEASCATGQFEGAQDGQRSIDIIPCDRLSGEERGFFEETSYAFNVHRMYTILLNQNALPNSDFTKAFLEKGRIINEKIKDCKQTGQEYMGIEYFGMQGNLVKLKISVRHQEENLGPDELTKNRFLAVVHVHNFKSQFDHRSALTMRLDFTEVDWERKTMFMALVGAGFQFQGKFIMQALQLNEVQKEETVRIYYALCHVMDYLSITNRIEKNHKLAAGLTPSSIFDYLKNPTLYYQTVNGAFEGVVEAAKRNIGREGIAIIQKCSESDLAELLRKLTIDSNLEWRRKADEKIILAGTGYTVSGLIQRMEEMQSLGRQRRLRSTTLETSGAHGSESQPLKQVEKS